MESGRKAVNVANRLIQSCFGRLSIFDSSSRLDNDDNRRQSPSRNNQHKIGSKQNTVKMISERLNEIFPITSKQAKTMKIVNSISPNTDLSIGFEKSSVTMLRRINNFSLEPLIRETSQKIKIQRNRRRYDLSTISSAGSKILESLYDWLLNSIFGYLVSNRPQSIYYQT